MPKQTYDELVTSATRLHELRDFFAAAPDEKIDMSVWQCEYNAKGNNKTYSCMTAGCLAGWAAVYKPFKTEGFKLRPNSDDNLTPSYKSKEMKIPIFGVEGFAVFFGIDRDSAWKLTIPASYQKKDGSWTDVTKAMVLKRLDATIKRQMKRADKLAA